MNKTLLDQAKDLLKAAKESPEKFETLKKDDLPHPPNSPEDKAHDVAEEDDSIKHALAILDTPDKQRKMFEHLRTLMDQTQLRSPENKDAGEETFEKDEDPTTKQYQNKRIRSKKVPTSVSNTEQAKGVHGFHWQGKPGESTAGMQIREKASMVSSPKDKHAAKLKELKNMPKPNLPKSEIGESKMDKSELLKMAQDLLKIAKESPEKFEELTKASSAPPPVPKPAAPAVKPPATAAKLPVPPVNKPQRPTLMTKDEIKEDLKKEWKPKFKKEGC